MTVGVEVTTGVGEAGAGPTGGSVTSTVGRVSAGKVGVGVSGSGEGVTVADGAQVQAGRGVGVTGAVGGPGRATMIRLMTMLAARTALMIQKRVWLALRLRRRRLRLLTEINLLKIGQIIPQVVGDASYKPCLTLTACWTLNRVTRSRKVSDKLGVAR